MQIDDVTAEEIRRVAAEWNKAEETIKLAEQVCGEIVNPAIYELRYAGRRLIEAIAALDQNQKQDTLDKLKDALFDCQRAQHDAIDAATSKIVSDLDIGLRRLGAKAITTHFSEIHDLFELLSQMREKVAQSRKQRENRNAIYDALADEDFPELIRIYRRFKSSEGLIKKAARIDAMQVYGGLAIGVIGVILTIMSFLK